MEDRINGLDPMSTVKCDAPLRTAGESIIGDQGRGTFNLDIPVYHIRHVIVHSILW